MVAHTELAELRDVLAHAAGDIGAMAQRAEACERALLTVAAKQALTTVQLRVAALRGVYGESLPGLSEALARAEAAALTDKAQAVMTALAAMYDMVVPLPNNNAARIDVIEALSFWCLSEVGHRDRDAFEASVTKAFGRPLTAALLSQVHKAYGHRMSSVPGHFRSNSAVHRRRRSQRQRGGDGAEAEAETDVLEPDGVTADAAPQSGPEPQSEPDVAAVSFAATPLEQGLSHSMALRLQLEVLLTQCEAATTTPGDCSDCAYWLGVRLNDLDWNSMEEKACEQFASRSISALTTGMLRFPQDDEVQRQCLGTLRSLCRYAQFVLGVRQVTNGQTASLDGFTAERLWRHLTGVILCEERYYNLHGPARWVLARTQPLAKLMECSLLQDSEAREDLLGEVYDGLQWYLQQAVSPSCPGNALLAKEFLQFLHLAAAPVHAPLDTECWVRKAWQNPHKMRLAFVMVGIFFDLGQEILSPLMHAEDEQELVAAHKALYDLTSLELLRGRTVQQIVDFILKRGSFESKEYDSPQISSDCRNDCVGMLGFLLRGAASSGSHGSPSSAVLDSAVREAVDLLRDCGCGSEGILDAERVRASLHVAFWTLAEVFEGDAPLGEWNDVIRRAAAHALRDLPAQTSVFKEALRCMNKVKDSSS